MTVYASTKYAVEGLTDGLRRALSPWGITVIRIHPSSVTGTEFAHHATRSGAVKYRSIPIGRVSRETMARKIVDLIEKPRRALFISRLYDVPVMLNRFFPGFVDWVSATWVLRRRKKELDRSEAATTVHYYKDRNMLGQLFGAALMFALVAKLWRKKQ
jgi:short-subunit dehydrogenase